MAFRIDSFHTRYLAQSLPYRKPDFKKRNGAVSSALLICHYWLSIQFINCLVRAFRTAGAQSVLMTTQPIGDRSSKEFFINFYEICLNLTGLIFCSIILIVIFLACKNSTCYNFNMNTIPFYKMSGAGNDFIIIDNRAFIVDNHQDLSEFSRQLCHRRLSIGADGLFLIENSDKADFRWQFFNADGSRADMCGNGARCVARFAYLNKIAESSMSFETGAGIIFAEISGDTVKIKMTDPGKIEINQMIEIQSKAVSFSSVNTGVPHLVVKVDDIETADVVRLGREIRYHNAFAPAGINVNFINQKNNVIFNRTYERGVEDETLACGTGAVAAAIITAYLEKQSSPIQVIPTSRQPLLVHFKEKDGRFYDLFLEGNARILCKGQLCQDAWNWNIR